MMQWVRASEIERTLAVGDKVRVVNMFGVSIYTIGRVLQRYVIAFLDGKPSVIAKFPSQTGVGFGYRPPSHNDANRYFVLKG